MTTIKFYHFDERDELYLGIAQVSVERISAAELETEVYFERVVNTETHEEIFPDENRFDYHFRNRLMASAIDCHETTGMEERAEKYWAEYEAEEPKQLTVACRAVFLSPDNPQTIIVYQNGNRAVRYKLLTEAADAPMRYTYDLPQPVQEYLNWVAAGCPVATPELEPELELETA